jgi:hypothetical protein
LLPIAAWQIETTLVGHEMFAEDAVRSLIGALGWRKPLTRGDARDRVGAGAS